MIKKFSLFNKNVTGGLKATFTKDTRHFKYTQKNFGMCYAHHSNLKSIKLFSANI